MINFKKFTSYTPDEDKSELVEAGVVFYVMKTVMTGMNVRNFS